MLWKHKVSFHIFQIYVSFLGHCRALLIRVAPDIYTEGDRYLLEGKGFYYFDKGYLIIQLLNYEESPTLLPKFFTDRLFMLEVCIQYLSWSTFLEMREKCQFIQILFSLLISKLEALST